MSFATISFQQWQQHKNAGDLLVDVRGPAEYAGGHVPGSVNLPLGDCSPAGLNKLLAELGLQATKVCLICKTGQRSQMAAKQLQLWSEGELCLMDGGVDTIGIELNKTAQKNVIPLERQVLVAAGSLVLLGVVLGAVVNPGFYGLSAFVGAGLMVAGLTGFCGMGLLLARMPWNKR
ncbi:rhodanese-like domain-containing protein [Maricurvus nonylphenolicus]|uniref:rhodanese-like domain-containing protein n=1 Tax=Maricurvus nonylphenolicus TaxID=1008307 RepID=UPI0036F370D2